MKAYRLYQPKPAEEMPLRLEEIPTPGADLGEILIEVKACGICRTDLHTVEGDIHPPRLPVTPGHQVVGEVVGIGRGVEKFKVGDRVGVPWLYEACGACEFCRRGEENLCPLAKFTGFHRDGGYAEYMIAQAKYALPLPASIEDKYAAPLLCAGIIGYRSLHRAEVKPGERLGLVGFGASAHLAIQVAKHWGCEVYAFTRAEKHRRHALILGAAWAGGIDETPPHPVDRMVLFAPNGMLVPLALEKIRPGGTLAVNAVTMSDIPGFPYNTIYMERTLRSVANATYQDGEEFLKLAEELSIRADVKLYSFVDAGKALIDLKNSKIAGEGVLVAG